MLLSPLGRGSYGLVWRALDDVSKKYVAVKFYTSSRGAEEDFEQERTALAKVASAGQSICDLVACPIASSAEVINGVARYYVVLELVEYFTDLRQLTSRSMHLFRNPPKTVQAYENMFDYVCVKIALAVARSVVAMHQAGVVHRDLHSSNILITDVGQDELQAEAWYDALGKDAIDPLSLLETNLERYLRLRPLHNFPEYLSETQFVEKGCGFHAKLVDLNLAAIDDNTLKDGSKRDPTLRGIGYTFEQCKATDAWDFGLILFEIVFGDKVINTPYIPEMWSQVTPKFPVSDEDLEARKQELFEESIQERDISKIMQNLGRRFNGYMLLPQPFTTWSKLLSFDFTKRPTVEEVQLELQENYARMST